MKRLAIIIFTLLFAQTVNGQGNTVLSNPALLGVTQQQNYSASYIIPSTTGISMAVNIWGEVMAPGQYLIPYSINLDIISLLSQAGGPTREAKLSKVLILRDATAEDAQERIIVDIKEFISTGDRSALPNIEPNDTIILLPTFMANLRRQTAWVDILYRFATVYILIDRYSN